MTQPNRLTAEEIAEWRELFETGRLLTCADKIRPRFLTLISAAERDLAHEKEIAAALANADHNYQLWVKQGEEAAKYKGALERIALLDEADGHELTVHHALQAVAIATSSLGKHPSEILSARARLAEIGKGK